MAKKKIERHVKCPNCGEHYFRVTKSYRATVNREKVMPHAGMIEIMEPWKGWGWSDGLQDETNGYGDMICPGCSHMLAPDGRLIVDRVEV
jgi:hypothetical protein